MRFQRTLDQEPAKAPASPSEYPVYYFFYGTLTAPSTLKWILDLPEEPLLRKAQLTGYALGKWVIISPWSRESKIKSFLDMRTRFRMKHMPRSSHTTRQARTKFTTIRYASQMTTSPQRSTERRSCTLVINKPCWSNDLTVSFGRHRWVGSLSDGYQQGSCCRYFRLDSQVYAVIKLKHSLVAWMCKVNTTRRNIVLSISYTVCLSLWLIGWISTPQQF